LILSEIVGLLEWLQSMIELSRTQDEEVGDGTTSVIILGMLFVPIYKWKITFSMIYQDFFFIFSISHHFCAAGEMLHVAEAFIDKNYHPTVICRGNV